LKNILVFPCGTEIGLEIYRSLKYSKHFRLFGGNSIDDHGKFVYSNYISNIPYVYDADFIERINSIIEENKINFIIPAHDSAIHVFSKNIKNINAKIIGSPFETCDICNSKYKTYNLFQNIIEVPIIYDLNNVQFQCFLKPEVGQGSKGTYVAQSVEDIIYHIKRDPSLLILEYLPGKEYTVDCFTDRHGNLKYSRARERSRILNGISVNSKPVDRIDFQHIAEKISKVLTFRGVWFFQVKERKDGTLVLMEISPRIAGTMGLFRNLGVNFIEMSLFDAMNCDIKVIENKFHIEIDRALQSRYSFKYYYEEVYIDLDDTILLGQSVNITAITFLYQCRNNGKKIKLITRHDKNVKETLKKYSIDETIFSEIIVLTKNDNKSDWIKKKNSIFIDDSFKERNEVYENIGIPVFGVDALESLIEF
jgi:hypothetical protein